MNEIDNKFLLAVDIFLLEIHLKQFRFTNSTCGPFTKNKERIQKLRKAGDTKYIYRNKLDKTCFHNDKAYGDFNDLAKRTASDRAFNIAKYPKYDGYQRGLASMVYKFFDKKLKGGGANNEIKPDKQLAEKSHKSIITKF